MRLPLAILLSGLLAHACAAEPATGSATSAWREVAGVRVPVLKMPLYVMEFHLWYDTPIGAEGRPGWFHGGAHELADTESMGPDWMRLRNGVGWPLPGSYASGDPGIIRWQLQCLKATGVDGVFIQLFADWNKPERFHRIPEFETLLRIAEEVGVQVAIHDEVQFRNPGAKDPATMARRAGEALKKYGASPAYLRIDGKPAYAFQWWGQLKGRDFPGMSHEQLQQVFQDADRLAGTPSFWMPFKHASDKKLLAMPEFGGGVVMSNCNNQFREVGAASDRFASIPGWTPEPPGAVMTPAEVATVRQARQEFPGKKLGLWAYTGFDNTTQKGSTSRLAWLPRREGRTLAEAFAAFQDYGCDFVMLTSWNDWEENTAIEPGFLYDGYAGDPYLYCRIVAAAKGRDFVVPPLPPKESVDPLLWQRLYGIDRTPPRVSRLRYLPMGPAVIAEVVDSGSAVAGASLRTHGDLWGGVGPDGTVGGDGLTLVGTTGPSTGSFLLEPGKSLTFSIDRARLAAGSEWWVAVEAEDSAKGALRIHYPAQFARADHRPSDEGKITMEAAIHLSGTGAWRADTRLLRAVDAGKNQPLTIRWDAKEGSVRVARVHLFRTQGGAAGTPGLEISGAKEESQVKSYRLATPGLQSRPVPGTIYLELTDAAGNRSHPIPVSGGRFGDILGNRP